MCTCDGDALRRRNNNVVVILCAFMVHREFRFIAVVQEHNSDRTSIVRRCSRAAAISGRRGCDEGRERSGANSTTRRTAVRRLFNLRIRSAQGNKNGARNQQRAADMRRHRQPRGREQCRCAQLALQATILQARSGKLCFTFARALTGSGSNCNCNKKTLNIASWLCCTLRANFVLLPFHAGVLKWQSAAAAPASYQIP